MEIREDSFAILWHLWTPGPIIHWINSTARRRLKNSDGWESTFCLHRVGYRAGRRRLQGAPWRHGSTRHGRPHRPSKNERQRPGTVERWPLDLTAPCRACRSAAGRCSSAARGFWWRRRLQPLSAERTAASADGAGATGCGWLVTSREGFSSPMWRSPAHCWPQSSCGSWRAIAAPAAAPAKFNIVIPHLKNPIRTPPGGYQWTPS